MSVQTVQVELPLLKDPLKQPFVASHVPARSPFTWTAGLPRVVPVWFHGDDRQAGDAARAQQAVACHRPARRHSVVIPPTSAQLEELTMFDRPAFPRSPSAATPTSRPKRRLSRAAIALAVFLTLIGAGSAHAAPPTDTSGRANGVELTARWWPVALSTGDFSFFEDSTTGGNCRQVNLPSGPVLMVAGTLGGASGQRACTIPAGASVLLPVLNAAFFLTDDGDTVGLARAVSRDFLAGARVEATVDGVPVRIIRKKGPVVSSDLSVLGVEGPVRTTVDGFWLKWEAEPGTHTVTTFGIALAGEDDEFMTSTSYTFFVT